MKLLRRPLVLGATARLFLGWWAFHPARAWAVWFPRSVAAPGSEWVALLLCVAGGVAAYLNIEQVVLEVIVVWLGRLGLFMLSVTLAGYEAQALRQRRLVDAEWDE